MQTTTDLKKHLKELINKSPALNSLPADEKKTRTDVMLSADEATMKEFIKVLEDELKQVKKIDEDMEKEAENLANLLAEATALEKTAERELSKEKEEIEREVEAVKAEEMLKKLDEIAGK